MQFKLFYKEYDCKPSLAAIKMFREATGLDLWSSLTKYMVCYTECRRDGVNIAEMLSRLAQVLDFIQSSQLLYCLGKQSNKSLTISEIEDAMFHAGILPSNDESDLCEPYPIIIYKLALDVNEYHVSLSAEKKAVSSFLVTGMNKSEQEVVDFDYLDWWKFAVKSQSIQPSEAWKLDYVELVTLGEIKQSSTQDASFMVNRERMQNGCKKSQLKNLNKV